MIENQSGVQTTMERIWLKNIKRFRKQVMDSKSGKRLSLTPAPKLNAFL